VRHLKAFSGILQADACNGYNELYDPSRAEGSITLALCWAMPGGSSSSWRTSPP
jgi:transposase